MKTGAELIADERNRQIEVEGWTPEHDATHKDGDLAMAGICYAADAIGLHIHLQEYWPWGKEWWKPTPDDPVRQLVKACSLIVAEIDKRQSEAQG